MKLTDSGIIAHNIKEIHSLAIADVIKYSNYFDLFNSAQIAAYLSIFSNINVKDDYKKFYPEVENPHLKDIITFTKTSIEVYEDLENKYQVYTATNGDLNYDIVNYVQQWCESTEPDDCKKILYNCLYSTDLFVGDFIKAILKINNIANELDRVCDLIGNKVELQNKIRQIPKITLKFIATNQSLYI
jgi:superfamily II RNA helicase